MSSNDDELGTLPLKEHPALCSKRTQHQVPKNLGSDSSGNDEVDSSKSEEDEEDEVYATAEAYSLDDNEVLLTTIEQKLQTRGKAAKKKKTSKGSNTQVRHGFGYTSEELLILARSFMTVSEDPMGVHIHNNKSIAKSNKNESDPD
ncbi:hypothetical protein HJC23_000014 [Cyclotella cryptica]|uniref:Uncharacterized protein n=1 Tax=Cyclotella cryptica TaxID=29204 RepID=A0ABD3P9J5_9STRA